MAVVIEENDNYNITEKFREKYWTMQEIGLSGINHDDRNFDEKYNLILDSIKELMLQIEIYDINFSVISNTERSKENMRRLIDLRNRHNLTIRRVSI